MTYFSSETIKKASEKDQKRMKRKTLKCCKKKIPQVVTNENDFISSSFLKDNSAGNGILG